MPSFDVVSEVDNHELTNAIDQANREIGNRFDFKNVDAKIERQDAVITLSAEAEFQLQQMLDMLKLRMAKRRIDVACLEPGEVQMTGQRAQQPVTVRQGLDAPLAKRLVKMIKDSKLKVQAAIQGEKLRVSGKKRDDLQKIIELLKDADIALPLQYENFRD